jgi:hypothetical protein
LAGRAAAAAEALAVSAAAEILTEAARAEVGKGDAIFSLHSVFKDCRAIDCDSGIKTNG